MDYSGVGIIIENQEGKLLLHLRDGKAPRMSNQWCLIGGSLDKNEAVLAGAVRETKEETNLTLVEPSIISNFNYQDKSIALVKGVVDSEKDQMILGEGAELKFFTKEEIVNLLETLDYSNPYLDQLKNYV